MGVSRRLCWGLYLAHQRHEQRGQRETRHDHQEGVGIGQRLRFTPRQCPELAQCSVAGVQAVLAESLGVAAPLLDPGIHCLVLTVKVLGKAQEMQVGAVVEHGGAGGDSFAPQAISVRITGRKSRPASVSRYSKRGGLLW